MHALVEPGQGIYVVADDLQVVNGHGGDPPQPGEQPGGGRLEAGAPGAAAQKRLLRADGVLRVRAKRRSP
jgi:hypothetical protein